MKTEHPTGLAEQYWRGELHSSEKTQVDRHLNECTTCRESYDAIGIAVRALAPWAESRIDASLEERLVRLRPPRARTWLIGVAAALALLLGGASGFAFGRQSAQSPIASQVSPEGTELRTFMLLLEESRWPPTDSLRQARSGYSDWVQDLRSVNRYVGAEKFTEEAGVRVLANGRVSTPQAENLSGWYLVRARDYGEAVALARRGPHLQYGSILVRQVE